MNSPDLEQTFPHEGWSPTMCPLYEEDDSNSSCSSLGLSALSFKSNGNEDNNPEEEEKICVVCGDKANGYHFHVLTCEGCKGFFRRSITKRLQFTCPFTRSCPITKAKRRQCQACRLQKCLDVGMRKDMIMTDDALALRRALRSRKKQERLHRIQPVSAVGSLTGEQKQLISLLIDAQDKHLDASFTQFGDLWLPDNMMQLFRDSVSVSRIPSLSSDNPSPPIDQTQNAYTEMAAEQRHSDIFGMVPHFASISTVMIQQVIKFAKEIPTFRDLPIDDQISLLKGSTMEICEIQFNSVFNLETNTWECGKNKYSIQHAAMTGFQQIYLEEMLKFHINFRKLKLHKEEYALLQGLALFSPGKKSRPSRSYTAQCD
ncbi:nuclear receptor subfamily 1 group I member 2-like isoform 2-T2 [Discoglossus pictus]